MRPRAWRWLVVVALLATGRALLGTESTGLAALPPGEPPISMAYEPGPVAGLAAAPARLAPFTLPTHPDQWFNPSGRNQGTEGLARFLAAVALRDNKPLYLSDNWGRTTGSDLSDHHVSRSDSWACDVAVLGIQAPTPATEEAAKRIAAALGVPNWTGGDLTTTIKGYRFQILWKVAGHFNHVHVGVRKVG
jgi:hypothetical protein